MSQDDPGRLGGLHSGVDPGGSRRGSHDDGANIRFLAACLTDVTADARVIKFGSTLCLVVVSLFGLACST